MTLIRMPGVKLVNVANAREHFTERSERTGNHRRAAADKVRSALRLGNNFAPDRARSFLPAIITVTRIAPNKLDTHDGLRAACKPVIDGIADALIGKIGTFTITKGRKAGKLVTRVTSDDSDDRLTFRCNQIWGGVRTYGCLIRIEPRVEGPIRCWNDTASVQVYQSDAVLGPHAYIVLHDESEDNAAGVPFPAPQLRAFITQCERDLAALEAIELRAALDEAVPVDPKRQRRARTRSA